MAISTSLGLRALFKAAVVKSGLDRSSGLVSGLTPTAKALYVAAAAHAAPRAVVLVVVPADRDIELLVADTRFLLAELEGLSPVAAERAVAACPSHEVDPYRGLPPHGGVLSARARALHGIATAGVRVVVASAAALLPRVSAPARLRQAAVDVRVGQEIAPERLADVLIDAGFRREDPADEPGEFALRGGILDVYPPGAERPVRIEFVGDTVESLRAYEPETQRSIAALDHVHVVPLRETFPHARPDGGGGGDSDDDRSASLFDYLSSASESRVLVSEIDEVKQGATKVLTHLAAAYQQAISGEQAPRRGRDTLPTPDELCLSWDDVAKRFAHATRLEQLTVGEDADSGSGARGGGVRVRTQPVAELHGRVGDWIAEIRRLRAAGETVLFVAATPGRAERTVEILKDYDIFAVRAELADDARYAAVVVAVGGLARGVRLPDAGLTIFAEGDVFEEERHAHDRRPSAARTFLSDLRDLKVGDFVVHVDHGIGTFVGLKQLGVGESNQEFLELRYAGDDKLFVPVERMDLVQKYTGANRPSLDRLGGTTWERAKTKVKKAMRDMAEELLKLYAARKALPGHAFSPDSHWQQEFEDAFEWELTPDQRSAVADIKRDMESAIPMDRLLCGDVGYGKTEVAMRAAFKAVMDGKQVAILAPTTVLVFQHQKTLRERFAGFPIRVDMVSRFRSKSEQAAALADLAGGKLDIIVGTHRLLSKDVRFHDLGLLVVDEEQRFGVAHKERIKQIRKKVDVLTMSATPIPRTLNMSLVGVRDMSIIETPPKDRLSIQTNVVKFDQHVIQRAIRTELERHGQVFFVHNRVESIFSIGALIARLVPEARVVVGHGQMSEEELERAMLQFVAREFDVLLATTIIENGLDIPNANTIIINRADRYGLSQLYQLRGRVGRSDRPAYAYLLIPPEDSLSQVAKKRLAAIKEFSDLGSGFRVAALDLEIRGAGNLLGGEQSGQMDTVGFEMYLKLLEETIRELKGEDIEDDVRANVNLRVDLWIEDAYVQDMNQRLMLYRKIAAARAVEEIERVLEEAVDRYGPLPDSLRNLADYGRIRVMADQLGIDSIDREGRTVVLKFGSRTTMDPVRLVALVQQRRELTLVPPSAIRLDLTGGAPPVAPGPPPAAQGPRDRLVRRSDGGRATKGGGKDSGAAPSWWTTRAKAGAVTPGFSRAAVLRAAPIDPRAEGGVFDRVGGLLSDLLNQR